MGSTTKTPEQVLAEADDPAVTDEQFAADVKAAGGDEALEAVLESEVSQEDEPQAVEGTDDAPSADGEDYDPLSASDADLDAAAEEQEWTDEAEAA